MNRSAQIISFIQGVLAAIVLLTIYFLIVSLVSGWDYALDQFKQFWIYVVPLAVGFGIQFGLYRFMKISIKGNVSPRTVATTGTTSTVAMISCCAHYLTNILPILGTVGIITILSQYQIQLFWIGLGFNLLGILYMGYKVYSLSKHL